MNAVYLALKWFLYLTCLALGPILGFLLSGLWAEGANTFWKKIDYFPLPVEKIASMQRSGNEFWVQADDNAIYHIRIRVKKVQCVGRKTIISQSLRRSILIPMKLATIKINVKTGALCGLYFVRSRCVLL